MNGFWLSFRRVVVEASREGEKGATGFAVLWKWAFTQEEGKWKCLSATIPSGCVLGTQ